MGHSQAEIDSIQERWVLRFPADLIDLLREQRPLVGGSAAFDWIVTEPNQIQGMLDWPFEGFLFDVEHNNLWWPDRGDRPEVAVDRHERLREIFARVPKLIPLYGHRYLPSEPFEPGNPVLSVYQTDIICYGSDLADWIDRERGGWISRGRESVKLKEVPFWSAALRQNGAML